MATTTALLRTSVARTATRLVVGALIALATLPPLLWLGVGALLEQGHVRSMASAIAWAVEHETRSDHDGALAHAQQSLGMSSGSERVLWRGLLDARSTVVAESGERPGGPALSATAPLRLAASELAGVRVERALWPLLRDTVWVALLSSALAFAWWALKLGGSVNALRRAEARMRTVASIDSLTGLLNRDGVRRRLQRALDRDTAGEGGVGVLMIDLDRFGLINDTLGHSAGDQLLRGVADRFRAVTRDGDGLARLGADQFAVQVEGLSGPQALGAMARNLLRAFEAPFMLDERSMVVTLSVGVSLAEPGSGSVDTLLHEAGVALRAAKLDGGNRSRAYDAAMEDDDGSRLDLEQRLRGALPAEQFFVVYQAIVDASSRRVGTVEALLRWNDPQRGVVSPMQFIPLLEQTGLIVPVGRWVMEQACRQAAMWTRELGQVVRVSVNLSPRQFAEPDFLDMVAEVVARAGITPDQLQLEVTEGLLLDPTPQTLTKINALADSGVRLAVDDFGMGYSSLMYLKRFRLHTLKIDRMFVRDIAQQAQDLAIVRAIIDLGHGLGLRVTAEGVETEEQCHVLRRLGCDTLQGYLFGRPQVAHELDFSVPQDFAPTARATLDEDTRPALAL
jgi:diguanylate cyclase (GGDEF)-like protein